MLTVNDIINNTLQQIDSITTEEKTAAELANTPIFTSDLASKLHKVASELKQYNKIAVTTADVVNFSNRLRGI